MLRRINFKDSRMTFYRSPHGDVFILTKSLTEFQDIYGAAAISTLETLLEQHFAAISHKINGEPNSFAMSEFLLPDMRRLLVGTSDKKLSRGKFHYHTLIVLRDPAPFSSSPSSAPTVWATTHCNKLRNTPVRTGSAKPRRKTTGRLRGMMSLDALALFPKVMMVFSGPI